MSNKVGYLKYKAYRGPMTDNPAVNVAFFERDVRKASAFLEEAYQQNDNRLVKLAKKQLREAETNLAMWQERAGK